MFSKAVSVFIAAVVLASIAPAAAVPLGKEPKHPVDSQQLHYPVGIPVSSASLPIRTAHIGDSHDDYDDHVPFYTNVYTPCTKNALNWPLGIPITESIKPREAVWTAHPTVAVPLQQTLMTEVPLFTVVKEDGSDNVWVPPTVKGIRTTVFGEDMVKRAQVPTLVATPTLKTIYTPTLNTTYAPTFNTTYAHTLNTTYTPTLKTTYTPVRIQTPRPTRKPQPKSTMESSQVLKFIRNLLQNLFRRLQALNEQKKKENLATISGLDHVAGQVQGPDGNYHDFEDTAYHHPEQVHGGAKHEASHIANHHPDPAVGELQYEASRIANHHYDPVDGSGPVTVLENLQPEAIHTPTLQPIKLLSLEHLMKLTPEQMRAYSQIISDVRNAVKEKEILQFEEVLHSLESGQALDFKDKESQQFHPGHIDIPETGRSYMLAKRSIEVAPCDSHDSHHRGHMYEKLEGSD